MINSFKFNRIIFVLGVITTGLLASVVLEDDKEVVVKDSDIKVNNYYYNDAKEGKVKINYAKDEKLFAEDYIDRATAKIIKKYYEDVLSLNLLLPDKRNEGKTSIYQNIEVEKIHNFIKPIYKVKYEKLTPIDMRLTRKFSSDYLEVDNTFFWDLMEFAVIDFTRHFIKYKEYIKMSKIVNYKHYEKECKNSMNMKKCIKLNIEKGKKILWEW